MRNYVTIQMKNFYRNYDRVIGFRPTGWTLQKKKGTTSKTNSSVIGTTTKGHLTLHTVPYSEHSSFPELVECLESLNPKRIIPTVNTSKSQQQIDLLMTHWRLKQEHLFLEAADTDKKLRL
jgi:DNA cross-link repair 1A protein